MKNKYLIIVGFIVFLLGCEKDKEPHITPINPPKSITIVSGNNQIGYPSEYLSDSIVLEITPENIDDLNNYSYYFKSKDYFASVYSYDTILDSKMYVYAKWQLNSSEESQELTFFLNEKCDDYHNHCNKIDSILISASIKSPWKSVFSGANGTLYDIHFSDVNNGVLVGDLPFGSGYFKTNDGGITWSTVANNRNDLYQLSFADSDTGIVIVTNNWAYFTSNGGKSFYQVDWSPPIIGHQSSSDYFMFNSKEIFTVGGNATIAKSIDGGKSWLTYEGFSFKNYLYDITCVDKNTCYACGSIGKVVKTSDGGETWNEREILLNNYLKKIYFLDKDYGFSAGQYGALVRTINGGESWEIIKTGLRFTIIEIYFYNRDLGYIVSTSGEIGKTNDGGLTWEVLNKDNYGVYELRKVIFKNNAILGLQGGSIYKYELSNE
jgi:photosystem II stability/assembly factor-like uncharacterized protein